MSAGDEFFQVLSFQKCLRFAFTFERCFHGRVRWHSIFSGFHCVQWEVSRNSCHFSLYVMFLFTSLLSRFSLYFCFSTVCLWCTKFGCLCMYLTFTEYFWSMIWGHQLGKIVGHCLFKNFFASFFSSFFETPIIPVLNHLICSQASDALFFSPLPLTPFSSFISV